MGGVMNNEKRKGGKSIPGNVEDYLNIFQQDALGEIKDNGWRLKFVRRSDSEQLTIVLENTVGSEIAVLEEDGEINYESGIVVRENREIH
jgi:hypothetical protein